MLGFPRLLAVFVALFSMLFMQLAVASYACPKVGSDGNSVGSFNNVAAVVMENCEGMDMTQPTLCYAYAHDSLSHQSFDHSQLPDVQPFLAAGFILVLHLVDVPNSPQSPKQLLLPLAQGTSPPISIRNCCFRI